MTPIFYFLHFNTGRVKYAQRENFAREYKSNNKTTNLGLGVKMIVKKSIDKKHLLL